MLDELHPGEASALLFDWDGTLVDSQPANYRAMAAALAADGVTLEPTWFEARTGLSSAELVRTLADDRGIQLPRAVAEIVRDRDERFLRAINEVRLYPAVAAVVTACHGRLPMAVASGGGRRVIEVTLRGLPIRDRFDVLVTREDVEHGKPAPDIFLLAAELLGVRPERCVVYEDSEQGVAAAHAAGMKVIDVRPHTRSLGSRP